MELSTAVTVSILLMAALANGQFTPGAPAVCNSDASNEGGNDMLPHEKYCSRFHRCVGGTKYNFTCPENLLFNNKTCDYPHLVTCAYWSCDASKNNTNYPHECNTKYWKCVNGMYVMMNCTDGTYFNSATGQCGAGQPEYTEFCPKYNTSAGPGPCPLFPSQHGDECKYRFKRDNNTYDEDMLCPAGSSFNETICGCADFNENCPKPTNATLNKKPDPKCRASFVVDFVKFRNTSGNPQATSDKTGTDLPDTIKHFGATYSNGVATTSPNNVTQAGAYHYVWSYNDNELAPAVAFCATLRSRGNTVIPIQVFTMNYFGSCTPTLELNVTRSGNTYNANAMARGMNRYGPKGQITYAMATISATITVAGDNNYAEFCILINNVISLKLTDRGTSGTTKGTVVTQVGTTPIGTTLALNNCGLTFGKDLNGDIEKVAVYEGCGNTTIFNNY